MNKNDAAKQKVLNRLRTIKGHIAGIEKMIEDDKPCADILLQITAVKSSVYKVGLAIIEDHAMQCLLEQPVEKIDRIEVESVLKQILDYTK